MQGAGPQGRLPQVVGAGRRPAPVSAKPERPAGRERAGTCGEAAFAGWDGRTDIDEVSNCGGRRRHQNRLSAVCTRTAGSSPMGIATVPLHQTIPVVGLVGAVDCFTAYGGTAGKLNLVTMTAAWRRSPLTYLSAWPKTEPRHERPPYRLHSGRFVREAVFPPEPQ